MRVAVDYLVDRDGRLYFRRTVPAELREIIGKREWKKSLKLKVGQELEATAPVRRLTAETDRLISEAERQLASGMSAAQIAEQAEAWARANAFLRPTDTGRLSDGPKAPSAYDEWLENTLQDALSQTGKRHEDELDEADFSQTDWSRIQTVKQGQRLDVPVTIETAAENYRVNHKQGKLPNEARIAVDQLVTFMGDKALSDIRRQDVRKWINWLQTEKRHSPNTIRRRFSSIVPIVSRAIEDLELDLQNPFAKQKLPEPSAQGSEEKLPFHTSHLELIAAHLKSPHVRQDTKVIIRLIMDTTLGLKEAGGLDWADVRLEDDVPVVKVRPNAIRALKTKNRVRDFPLSEAAVEALRSLGRRSDQSGPVFPSGTRNYDALSQKLNKFIRAAGVPKSSRLTANSFRHTFEEAMRVARVEPDLQRYLMGHGQATMTERYGAARPLVERLQEAVKAALPERGKVDPGNYREGELPGGD
jgi:integrase